MRTNALDFISFNITRKHHCFIPCIPPRNTHQAGNRIFKSKDGKAFIGKSSKHKKTQLELRALLMQDRPIRPFQGACKIKVYWIFPFTKNETKANKEKGYIPCTKRPDCDNLAKGLLDAMQWVGYFKDDAQAYDLNIIKMYGAQSGIWLEVFEMI